jgi:hypothetical protein
MSASLLQHPPDVTSRSKECANNSRISKLSASTRSRRNLPNMVIFLPMSGGTSNCGVEGPPRPYGKRYSSFQVRPPVRTNFDSSEGCQTKIG